jgi:hypothetical protein
MTPGDVYRQNYVPPARARAFTLGRLVRAILLASVMGPVTAVLLGYL